MILKNKSENFWRGLLKGKIKFDQRPKISKSCSGQLNSGRLVDDEIKKRISRFNQDHSRFLILNLFPKKIFFQNNTYQNSDFLENRETHI